MAATLLIDAGNTRLKWAVLQGSTLGTQQAGQHAAWSAEQLRERVLETSGRVDRVLVANVGGPRVAALISEAVLQRGEGQAEFLQASARGGGIECGYADPAQLGVDRWAAMIGAYAMGHRPACVVSVGTAMTIDGITAAGHHLGGLIVPGPDLMISSLKRSTSDIAERARRGSSGNGLFADNTLGALQQGTAHALASLIDRASEALHRACGELPTLVITGGAASYVEQFVAQSPLPVPDLVLRGLSVLARETGVARAP